MAKIIEAKAVISAEDKTGAVFDKIAKKIEGIAKSAKSSAEVDKLSKALARARQQMAAINRFGAAKMPFALRSTNSVERNWRSKKAGKAMAVFAPRLPEVERNFKRADAAVMTAAISQFRPSI